MRSAAATAADGGRDDVRCGRAAPNRVASSAPAELVGRADNVTSAREEKDEASDDASALMADASPPTPDALKLPDASRAREAGRDTYMGPPPPTAPDPLPRVATAAAAAAASDCCDEGGRLYCHCDGCCRCCCDSCA